MKMNLSLLLLFWFQLCASSDIILNDTHLKDELPFSGTERPTLQTNLSLDIIRKLNTSEGTGVNQTTLSEEGKELESCRNGRAYNTLDECMSDCEHRSLTNSTKSLLNSTYDPFKMQTRKVLLLEPDEFNITDGRFLNIFKWDTSVNGTYILYPNREVRACLSLSPVLYDCEMWDVPEFRMKFYDNRKEALLTTYFVSYKWNEFYFHENDTFLCKPTSAKVVRYMYNVGVVVSVVSLGFGLIVSKFIEELRRNRLLLCNMLMLFINYISIFYRYFFMDKSIHVQCLISSSLTHFSLLSAFFWINAQSFDIWRTLRSINVAKTITLRRFLCYSIYCWGLPLILAIIGIVSELLIIQSIRPGFMSDSCWFYDAEFTRSFVYYFFWQGFSILVNIVLFSFIVCQFRKAGRAVSSVNKERQQQLLRVSIKLAVFMGIYWIFSWFLKLLSRAYGFPALIIWIFDILTSFQGLYIFLIYVLRRKHFKRIMKKIVPRTQALKENTNSSSVGSVSTTTTSSTI